LKSLYVLFRTRALLGFLPKSLELAPNQFLLHVSTPSRSSEFPFLLSLVFSQLGFSTNLLLFRVPSVFSSLARSRAVVLLGYASNVLYEPISRYGKLGFRVWVVFVLFCACWIFVWIKLLSVACGMPCMLGWFEIHGCCRWNSGETC